ncbi:MAG TPA: PAS domain S-box protein [Planctomycetaceae bacterium]|nr:PAS domain S-box protein [Planctomycetaceae bacterium]
MVRAGGLGTLVLGVPERGVWGIFRAAAERAPVAFWLPVALIVVGIVVLKRTLRPLVPIEQQLERLATRLTVSPADLEPVRLPAPAAVGWNRLVEALRHGGQPEERESRLAQALEGYRQKKSDQVLNSLLDGVAVTDGQGRITFANKALLGLLGRRPGEDSVCGQTMFDCLGLAPGGQAVQPLKDPSLEGRPVIVEYQRGGQIEDGVLRIVRTPLAAEPGQSARGHVWCVRDVTQQKLADQMREQFVNAATHELRTPLANIKAYSETLALGDMVDVEQQKAFCNTIDEEVTRLANFVDDLLHLSRMQVGSTCLNRQTTDMERLFREVVGKVSQQMKQQQITFEVELPGKLPELLVDKEKFTVAVVNLLGNAAKYTPEGGRIRLGVELREGDETLQIDVEDTGIGIAPQELPKIFDRFFRSTDPRVGRTSGSGLGLALTQEIVRLHGGKVTVESELNKGSRFTILLPTRTEGATCSGV